LRVSHLLADFAVALGIRRVPVSEPDGPAAELSNNELAMTRTLLASERTLMGWIRTALSMIGFGFTIGKLAQASEDGSVAGPLGLAQFSVSGLAYFLVLLGTFSLLAASVQHSQRVAALARRGLPHQSSIAFAVALLLGFLGIFAFAALVLEI